jgi:alkylation response protein AidB-like acyl-CoA dehydrogenase
VSLDFSLGEAEAIGQIVQKLMRERGGAFSRDLWRRIAALGLFALGTEEGGGGALEIVAAMEAFGAANCAGPLVETFAAVQVLRDLDRARVVSGDVVVSFGSPPLMPWAPLAGVFVELDPDGVRAFIGAASGEIAPVETLGGDPWGRIRLERIVELSGAERALIIYDVALAAELAALGSRLIEAAAEQARIRTQFGRPIATFQAVSHPLADAALHIAAARASARAAAFRIDSDDPGAAVWCAHARALAMRAAVFAADRTTQVFGGLGVTADGPVFPVARRIRHKAAGALGAARIRRIALASIGV